MTEISASTPNVTDQRRQAAADWAADAMGLEKVHLATVSADASFRRYFRFPAADRSIVLMDAPPEKENSAPFIDIASRLRSAGLKAPNILEFDLDLGFGLLEDFGDTLYRELITEQTADVIFPDLFALLEGMAQRVNSAGLPQYSETALATELGLFTDWYLERHRQRPLNNKERGAWDKVCQLLTASALKQPQVFVHRDFHSCNLLQTPDGPGIIDFQDGVKGPVSYDFVSLVWDRYITWPRSQLEAWMHQVHARLPVECSVAEWIRWCDWMGLQRNLKIVGIFARLKHRDGKDGYVEMIPRFYSYLLEVLPRYPEFHDFHQILEQDSCAP
jgi:aminoglycoside/choline kinase family phosphotransferase